MRHAPAYRASRLPAAGLVLVGIIFLFEVLPLLVIVSASFGTADYVEVPPRGFTLHWYGELVQRGEFTGPILMSIVLAGLSVLSSIILALPTAYALTRFRFRLRPLFDAVTLMPVIVPEIILAIALLQLWILFGGERSFGLSLMGHTILVFPFVLRPTLASLASLGPELEEAAIGLGASRITAVRRIVLPHARVGIVAGGILGAIVSFDAFFMTLFLNDKESLPTAIWFILRHDFSPSVPALATLMILITVLAFVVVERIFGLRFLMEQAKT
jgi:putative spermidine/putrescine transport system permease protein